MIYWYFNPHEFHGKYYILIRGPHSCLKVPMVHFSVKHPRVAYSVWLSWVADIWEVFDQLGVPVWITMILMLKTLQAATQHAKQMIHQVPGTLHWLNLLDCISLIYTLTFHFSNQAEQNYHIKKDIHFASCLLGKTGYPQFSKGIRIFVKW